VNCLFLADSAVPLQSSETVRFPHCSSSVVLNSSAEQGLQAILGVVEAAMSVRARQCQREREELGRDHVGWIRVLVS